jgi:L-alanine-DL-glutamate epimerase-like enolase superfamily enzyme
MSECRRIVAMGAAAGLPVAPHRGGSPYGLALIAASEYASLAESFGTGENSNELWQAFTAPFRDGYYYPSEKPGFGLDLSDGLLRRYVPQLVV